MQTIRETSIDHYHKQHLAITSVRDGVRIVMNLLESPMTARQFYFYYCDLIQRDYRFKPASYQSVRSRITELAVDNLISEYGKHEGLNVIMYGKKIIGKKKPVGMNRSELKEKLHIFSDMYITDINAEKEMAKIINRI